MGSNWLHHICCNLSGHLGIETHFSRNPFKDISFKIIVIVILLVDDFVNTVR